MKKFATLLVVFAMLASMLAISASAEKDGGQTNMEVTVPKFAAQPTIDGVISEEEWGAYTVRMVTDGAATLDNSDTIGENEYAKNIFYWYEFEGYTDELAYDLWIRWDENFLYVAAVVEDPDPFSLPDGGEEIWNGDMIQIRVDDHGPSAVMLKEDATFNYLTDSFNSNRYKKPWSNDKEVFNGIMGKVKGKTDTLWRCGKEYGNGWNLVGEDENQGGLVGITVVEHTDADGVPTSCTTTYEGAIPWAVIATKDGIAPAAGAVYGMAVSVACSDSNNINGWLMWGQGVTSPPGDQGQPRPTRGGSQAIILSADTVTPAAEYPVKGDEPEETEPVETQPVVTEPVATTPAATEAATEEATAVATATGTVATTRVPARENDKGGLSTGAIIAIVAAVVVVGAGAAIVIVKKKKS